MESSRGRWVWRWTKPLPDQCILPPYSTTPSNPILSVVIPVFPMEGLLREKDGGEMGWEMTG